MTFFLRQAHSKYAKSKQTLDLCEASYQSSVSAIEEARKSWERETEKSLMTFQSIEEDRLSSVRDSLWRVANIASLAAVADDLSAEEVRKTLETSKLDDTIQSFISEQASGKIRPAPITFDQQPTSSSLGMGRAADKLDTQSLIVGPVSTPTPSIDMAGRETPATVMYRLPNNNNSASLSSLRDISSYNVYTTTMPRGPFLQRHFSPDLQNNNEPPPIRPRKPPRLIHYAQGGGTSTLTRNNFSGKLSLQITFFPTSEHEKVLRYITLFFSFFCATFLEILFERHFCGFLFIIFYQKCECGLHSVTAKDHKDQVLYCCLQAKNRKRSIFAESLEQK